MPYTIGASHGPFSGRGNFVISKPAGIRTVTTSIPTFTGRDGNSPPRYWRLGRFTLGNVDGFASSVGLEYAQQLFYPLPAVWELLSYDIRGSSSTLFQELVEVPDLTSKQPWDRTPSPVTQSAQSQLVGGSGVVTMFSYTVPAGRRLFVSHASVRLRRVTAATAANITQLNMRLNTAIFLRTVTYSNVVGTSEAQDLSGGPMIAGPGAVLACDASNSDTGGDVRAEALLSGILFDA